MLGLFLSISHFELRCENSVIDFDSYLQPQDIEFLERNEKEQNVPVVFVLQDILDLIANMNPENQITKDLVDHIKMGHCVAPETAVKQAVEEMMQSADVTIAERVLIAEYQEALINGEALIHRDVTRRIQRHGRFCTLFVKKCAVLGCARVLGNLNVCGTISACNFTSFTGVTGGILFPGLVVDGDIVFNKAGTNPLFVEGAVEKNLKSLRGSLSLGTSAIILTSVAPDSAVTVGGILPQASIFRGIGYSTGATFALGSSSGISGNTSLGMGTEYYYVIKIVFPIIFNRPYEISPTIVLGFEGTVANPLVTANASTNVGLFASRLTINEGFLTLVFNVNAQGIDYHEATTHAANAINNILATLPIINFLVQGPVN